MPPGHEDVLNELRRQVGAVVIGRNEGERLRHCLSRVAEECDRVVYVDSGSTDDSVTLARSLGVGVLPLSSDRPFTAARGRREGLARLVEEFPDLVYVQFVDGDCILADGWLKQAVAFLEARPTVAAVCGRRFEAHPNSTFYNSLIDQEWNTDIGEAEACGGDSLMRVRAVLEVGSFRADLVAGEEPELCTRLRAAGWKIWRIDVPMTEHDANIRRFGEWWRRARRGGAGYAQVWSITRRTPNPLYGRQLASSLFWVLVVPLAVAMAAYLTGTWALLLVAPFLWVAQTGRIASRKAQGPLSYRLRAAALTMLVKVAEAWGAVSFLIGGARRQATTYRASPDTVVAGGRG